MTSLGERSFHLALGALFFGAVLFENLVVDAIDGWNPPRLGFVTFIVGLVWVGRYAAWRSELHDEKQRVLDDRVERLERLQAAIEDELRERYRRPL